MKYLEAKVPSNTRWVAIFNYEPGKTSGFHINLYFYALRQVCHLSGMYDFLLTIEDRLSTHLFLYLMRWTSVSWYLSPHSRSHRRCQGFCFVFVVFLVVFLGGSGPIIPAIFRWAVMTIFCEKRKQILISFMIATGRS